MQNTLTGKVALVTGASRGIGRAIALKLAAEGAAVVINYHGSMEKAKEVKAEIESDGGIAEIMQCNVADYQATEAMIRKVTDDFGRLDILVNNAGITRDGLLMKMSEEDYDTVLDTNLKGTFHCIRFAARQMLRQRGGRIINLSSVSGILGNAGQANYSASKAGVIGLTKSAARELASRGITVNAVAPGFIETEMTAVLTEKVRESAVAEIESDGGIAEIMQCNVADYQATEAMIRKVTDDFGRLDILVNNAGITRDGLLMKMSEEDYDTVLDTNLKGTFHCIRFAARQMLRQRGGRIINLSSVSGILGNAGQANYSASKAGVIGLTKSAARELASRGITVNAVAPGFIETEMTAVLTEKVRESAVAQIPMGAFGTAEDVAEAVAFLASDSARYITGQTIHVDGGMAM